MKRNPKLVCLALIALLIFSTPVIGAANAPVSHQAIWLMKRVGAPVPSPDGMWAVFSMVEPAYDDKDQVSDLWIVPADGSAGPRRLTSTKGGEAGAAWSPDSGSIAFSARRDGDEVSQIYVINIAEGGEALKVTSLSTGARAPRWRPDGKALLFSSTVYPGAANDAANSKIAAERKALKYRARVYDSFPIRNWDHWLDDTQTHVMIQSLEPGSKAVDLLAGTNLAKETGFGGKVGNSADEVDAVWAPDGASVVFVATTKRNTAAYSAPGYHLYQVPAAGGEPRQLTSGNHELERPGFSPDGKSLYCLATPISDKVYNLTRLLRFSWPEPGSPAVVTARLDRSVAGFAISPNSATIYLTAEDAGHEKIFSVAAAGGESRLLTDVSSGVYTNLTVPARASATVLFANWESGVNPAEIFRIDPSNRQRRAITQFNRQNVEAIDWQPLSHFWFTSKAGKKIHNMFVLPPGFDQSKKYPLVMLIHGGPHGMWRDQFFLRWNYHLFAQPGFVVLLTNYTGSAFLGLAFSRDGRTLYASGGNEDVIYRYAWRDKQASLIGAIVLAQKEREKDGTRFPAGIALSCDGRKLFVAENLADSLAVIDLASGRVAQRFQTEAYPYDVVVGPDGDVYVSAWGGTTVSSFVPDTDGSLKERGRITVGRHPSAMLLNRSGSRLFVVSGSTNRIAVVDTKKARVLTRLADPPPAGPNQGSTPNALALSEDGSQLYVAEADNNAVAVFQLSSETGRRGARLLGRIPVQWYPTALLMTRGTLFVLNGKGAGPRPNPKFITPDKELPSDSVDYTLGQLNGTITALPAKTPSIELIRLTKRVMRANNWDRIKKNDARYPPFKHVIYIIKENRTYDQILSDLLQGDGDASLLFFPRAVSPNHHALAERFGIFDRFFVNAEVSSQGHVWSTAAYVTDYGEKTIPSLYSSRRSFKEKGDVDEPASGYLWNAAIRKKLTLRNYGEFGEEVPIKSETEPHRYRASKTALEPFTCPEYPAFDMKIPDQVRADVWLKEFQQFVSQGNLPALQILHLPGDHTSGGRPGLPTPKAHMADNDLALGRIVEAVSSSPYWKDTVLFVLEDDAQDGPDHVDSHRSVLLVISAYNRGGMIHRFVNTTDVLASIEEILGLDKLSQFDFFGRPLREIFNRKPNLTPHVALKPEQPLNELNPAIGPTASASLELNLDQVDAADEDAFNRILWSLIKGTQPYPGTKRTSSLEIVRAY